jgi:hypothetical protein
MGDVAAAILVPLLTLIPGFVLVGVYRRNRREPDPSDAKFAALSFVASIVPHAIVLSWTFRLARKLESGIDGLSARETIAWLFVTALILPTLLGLGLSWIVETPAFEKVAKRIGWTKAARTRTAWTWAALSATPSWVIVTLIDGRLVGGMFGKASFIGIDAEHQDLFIAKPYRVNEDRTFGDPMPALGLWISAENIATVDFYEGTD